MVWYGKGYNGDDVKFYKAGEEPPNFWCPQCQERHLWKYGCPKDKDEKKPNVPR